MAKLFIAGRRKVVFAFLLLFGPAFLLIFIGTRGCQHKFKQLDDFGKAIDYSFTDVRGKQYCSKDFKGDIVLVTTIQPGCPDSCAISMWHLDQLIYQHIRKNKRKKMKQVRIISFVTDGKGNDLKDLTTLEQALKDHVEGYDPEIWILATGSARDLYNFERNGESLLKSGSQYFGGEAFQELMLLLDKDNHLRMVLSGKTEGMIRRMKEHIALLQKQYDKERQRSKQ
jgi:cytochrome oxidase Cu insertion factor (SCO1/SenC/PrrC family)